LRENLIAWPRGLEARCDEAEWPEQPAHT